MEKSKNPMEWLNLMVSEPYYLFHFLSFFSYFVLRSSASLVLSPSISQRLLHREIQAILVLAVLAAIKMVKDETWEAFIADVLFFAKLLLVAISLILDYHLAVWYILIFSVIYILTKQPAYQGLGTSSKLTPPQSETFLTEANTSRFWLYSNKNLSFGRVDLGLFTNAAEKFGISLSWGMSQLPTYILFENAAEVTRFPEWDFEAKSSYPPVTKRQLHKHVELDRLLLDYINGK